jgi:tetratricopeptide (TPR) repeat protein
MRIALVALFLICSSPVWAQESAMIRAEQAYSAGDYSTALAEYELIVASYPGNPIAWLRIARINAGRQQWPEAVSAYQMLASLGPLDRDVHMEYADALREAGQLNMAIEEYNQVLNSGPDKSLLAQADVAFRGGHLSDAQRLYENILSAYPAEQTSLMRLGQIHAIRGEWNEAASCYQALLDYGYDGPELRMEYGDVLREAGDLEQALVQYNMVVSGGSQPPIATTAPQPAPPARTSQQAPVSRQAPPPPPPAMASPQDLSAANSAPVSVPAIQEPQQPPQRPAPQQSQQQSQPEQTDWTTYSSYTPPAPTYSALQRDVPEESYLVREVNRAELVYPQDLPPSGNSVFFMQRDDDSGNGSAGDSNNGDEDTSDTEEHDWLLEARAYAAYGDWEAAVDAYEHLMQEQEISTAIRIEYGDALREADQPSLAIEQFNRILLSEPDNVDAKIGLAKSLALDGQLDEAMYLLDQVSMDAASMRKARLARAYSYYVNGYIVETWQDIGEVLALNPDNREAVAMLQQVEMGPENWDQFRQLLASVPGNEDVLELIDKLIEAERQQWLQLPSDQYDRAEALYLRGKYDQALREYEQLARTDPLNARIWMRLGTIYRWEEDWEESLSAYETYLRLVPDDYEAKLRYAQALLYSGNAADARDELESLVNAVDIPLDIYELALPVYASALNALGYQQQALRWYEEALVFDPHNVEVRVAYADTLAGQGKYDRAEMQYNLVLRDDPTNEAARMGLGRSYAWQGDYSRARQQYESVPMDSGYYSASRIGLAYTYLWQGRPDQARDLADEAARMDPQNPELAVLYESLRQTPGSAITPSASVTWQQSHDSDDNDTSNVITTIQTPVGRDSSLLITHEDFKLDNTNRGEETVGTRTRATVTTPLSDRANLSVSGSYLDLDNALDPHVSEWNWGTSVSFRMTDSWTAGVGYSQQTFYDTTELARNDIGINETWVTSDWTVDDNTRISTIYAYGDLDDGNQRNSAGVNLRKSAQWAGRGRLQYGVAGRFLSYDHDLNNGYWDPHNYRYGEVYADWLDLSDNPILIDAGVGFGVDKESGRSVDTVFRYNIGIRKPFLNNRLVLRAGYASSDAETNATTGPGYEYETWYLKGDYAF